MKKIIVAALGLAALLCMYSCGAPKAAKEEPAKETERIVTYAITFDTGKATLKPEADQEILRIRDLMNKYPELEYEVQGHCDNTGSDAINDKLSQQRAEAIVARLVELGISYDRLTPVGKGSHEPVADNKTEEGRAKNRRVEFIRLK